MPVHDAAHATLVALVEEIQAACGDFHVLHISEVDSRINTDEDTELLDIPDLNRFIIYRLTRPGSRTQLILIDPRSAAVFKSLRRKGRSTILHFACSIGSERRQLWSLMFSHLSSDDYVSEAFMQDMYDMTYLSRTKP